MRILLIEDDPGISGFVQQGLGELGYVVDVASEGRQGQHLASSGAYDVVIPDVMLPGPARYQPRLNPFHFVDYYFQLRLLDGRIIEQSTNLGGQELPLSRAAAATRTTETALLQGAPVKDAAEFRAQLGQQDLKSGVRLLVQSGDLRRFVLLQNRAA